MGAIGVRTVVEVVANPLIHFIRHENGGTGLVRPHKPYFWLDEAL